MLKEEKNQEKTETFWPLVSEMAGEIFFKFCYVTSLPRQVILYQIWFQLDKRSRSCIWVKLKLSFFLSRLMVLHASFLGHTLDTVLHIGIGNHGNLGVLDQKTGFKDHPEALEILASITKPKVPSV